MKNPKSEARNPNQIRNSKSEDGVGPARSVLECGGWRGTGLTPLWPAGRWTFGVRCSLSSQSKAAYAPTPHPPHSKTWRRWVAALALWAVACSASAQSYSLDWWTLAGGGGTSTGGVFSVSGTIGQPDAGVISGGPFTLVGGFWGVAAAVQTPGAPLLSVTRANAAVVLSWPLPATGWRLQATTNLLAAGNAWTEIPPPYPTNGANLQFTEPAPAGNKFYRLHKP